MAIKKLIGLYSSVPQSGKSTVAGVLAVKGFSCVPFAEPLKLMLIPLLCEMGMTEQQARHYLYVDKAAMFEPLGVTFRHLQQTLGTEWGRACISPDVWLRVWKERGRQYEYVVVDDVRFPNEAELIRSMGGEVWKVVRPSASVAEEVGGHPSEGGLDAWPHFANVIVNSGSIKDLYDAVASIPLG